MNFLIIGIKNNYHIERLKEEAEKRGHFVEGALPAQLITYASNTSFKMKLRGLSFKISEYNLIYCWAISSRKKQDWLYFLRDIHAKYKTKIIYNKYVDNKYNLVFSPVSDYYKEFKNKIRFPKTIIFLGVQSAKKAAKDFDFPAILKVNAPGMTSQGRGVFFVKNADELLDLVIKYKDFAHRFILREFIPNNGDIRVFVVGNKAIGAMYRMPKKGDFRSNISQGGFGEPFDLSKHPKVREIAEKAASITKTEIAGVDVMINIDTGEPYILEINSGPQFRGLENLAKINAAKHIIKYFEKRVRGHWGFV